MFSSSDYGTYCGFEKTDFSELIFRFQKHQGAEEVTPVPPIKCNSGQAEWELVGEQREFANKRHSNILKTHSWMETESFCLHPYFSNSLFLATSIRAVKINSHQLPLQASPPLHRLLALQSAASHTQFFQRVLANASRNTPPLQGHSSCSPSFAAPVSGEKINECCLTSSRAWGTHKGER